MVEQEKTVPESQASLRQQLDEACANVRRQIAVQQASSFNLVGPSGDALAIRELKAELAQLEEALSSPGPENT